MWILACGDAVSSTNFFLRILAALRSGFVNFAEFTFLEVFKTVNFVSLAVVMLFAQIMLRVVAFLISERQSLSTFLVVVKILNFVALAVVTVFTEKILTDLWALKFSP